MDTHNEVYKYSIRYSRDISIISSGEFNIAIINDEPTSRILILKYHNTDSLDTMGNHLIHVSNKYKFPSKRYNKYTDFIFRIFKFNMYSYLFEENMDSTIDSNSIPYMILPDNIDMLRVKEFKNNTDPINVYGYKFKYESMYEYEFNSGLRYYMLVNDASLDSVLAVENKETDDINILAYKPIGSCNRLMLSIIDNHSAYAGMIELDDDTYKLLMKRCIDKFKKCKSNNSITQEDL